MRPERPDHSLPPTPRTRPSFAKMLCAAFLLVATASGVGAQEAPVVEAGSRVRITSPALGLRQAVGTVREVADGALVVQFHNPRRAARIEGGDIAAMEVSVGRQRKALRGMGTGALVGGGAGLVLGFMAGDDPPECWLLCYSAEEKAAMLAVFLGGSGAVIGLITGALIKTDVWSPTAARSTLPADLQVRPVPGREGTAIRVGLSIPIR